MPNKFLEQFRHLFVFAIGSPNGLFALLWIVLAVLAWSFFHEGPPELKFVTFCLLGLGVVAAGYLMFRVSPRGDRRPK